MADLIKLVFSQENGPIAACPNCGGQKWYINLDAYDNDWEAINGTECVDCGYTIDWIKAERHSNDLL